MALLGGTRRRRRRGAAWVGGLAASPPCCRPPSRSCRPARKLAFDSLVQRDAPDANRGRSFARFETRFQLVWVIGALLPLLLLPIPDGSASSAIARHRRRSPCSPTWPASGGPPSPRRGRRRSRRAEAWLRRRPTEPAPDAARRDRHRRRPARGPTPTGSSTRSDDDRASWQLADTDVGDADAPGSTRVDHATSTLVADRRGDVVEGRGRGGRARGPGRRPRWGWGGWPASAQRRRRPSSPARSTHAGDERRAPVVGGLAELEAEQPLDEAVGLASASTRRRRRASVSWVAADELAADLVHHAVDDADDHGHQRLEPGEQGVLLGRGDGAEQHLGVAEDLLQAGEGAGVGEVELAEALLERAGVGRNPAAYSASRSSSAARTWGTPSTAWWASSCTHTHSHRSSRAGSTRRRTRRCWARRAAARRRRRRRGRGIGRSYWPRLRWARWPDHRAGGHRQHHRLHIWSMPANMAAIGSSLSSLEVVGWWRRGRRPGARTAGR